MVISKRFKVEYEDVNNGTTIIAETGQDTGAPKIDRHVHIRKKNDPDILKLRIEDPDFGNTIPTDKQRFATAQNGTDDPEILYKQFDPENQTFITRGRFYAKNSGSIDEEGRLAVKLFSFMKFLADEDVSVQNSTDIESALNEALNPAGYVADTGGASVPALNGQYSAESTKETVFQELTRNYNFAMTFTAELDSSNNYKVKFEPEGAGGTVSTLVDRNQSGKFLIQDVDTTNNIYEVQGDRTDELALGQVIQVNGSTGNDDSYTITALSSSGGLTQISVQENISDPTADGVILPGGTALIQDWQKNKTESVKNKITVEGVNKQTKNSITVTEENSDIQAKTGTKKQSIKIGYLDAPTDVEAQLDAQEIAQSFLVPEKGVSELPQGGTVKTPVFEDNVVNDSFQILSNRLNIDDTFTCVQQINFFPEGASKLKFEFEQEGLEKQAKDAENLRDERARLHPSAKTDVGNQAVNTGSAESNTGTIGGVGEEDDRGNNESDVAQTGGVDKDGGSSVISSSDETSLSVSQPGFNFLKVAELSGGSSASEGALIHLSFNTELNNNPSQFAGELREHKIRVNSDEGRKFPESDGKKVRTFHDPIDSNGDGSADFFTQENASVSIFIPRNTAGRDYDVEIETDASVKYDVDAHITVFDEHDHGDDLGNDNNAMGLQDDLNTDDSDHGGGSGSNQHGGSTDKTEVNIQTEDKTNR